MKESHVDVLVIGAGPAGLMCSLGLARAGVNVRVVDKRPSKVAAGQADGIQPRTIEVLQSYGLADRLLREANRMYMAAFYNPSVDGGIERTSRAPDVTAATARFPFEATLHQGAIEAIFLDELKALGVTVDRPSIPQTMKVAEEFDILSDSSAHAVTVELKRMNDDGTEKETEIIHAKFVVGGDGAHSWVRRTLGFTMDGEETQYIWGVLDIVPDSDFPDVRNRTAIHSDNGSCMIIPREGDKIRLYLQMDPSSDVIDENGRVDRKNVSPTKLLDVAKKSFAPYRMEAIGEAEWYSIYIIRQQVASAFSKNERVFIAGDACHTHSPKAGQGMNASMNDSHNLVWKLVHVLRGWAKMDLLKTYEAERRKYAQDLIAFDKKFAALFSGKPKSATNIDGVSHEDFLAAFQTFGGFTSGIGIHYQPSSLVQVKHQAAASKLIIGMRMVPQIILRTADARPFEIQDLIVADTRFKIIVFTGPTEDNRLLHTAADALEKALAKAYPTKMTEAVDIISICTGEVREISYNSVPAILRPHWTKAFVDCLDITGKVGGRAYETYGIAPDGAIVIVRPDGYVGNVLPLDKAAEVETYFGAFTTSP